MLCKIVLPNNEIFKLSSFPQNFEELLDAVKIRLRNISLQNITLKYMDCDKELINLNNNEDFKTAVLSNEAEQIKTLKVFVLPHGHNQISSINNESSRDFQENEQKDAIQTLNALENFGNYARFSLTPGQAFKAMKSFSCIHSNYTKEMNKIALINNQMEAIDNFIGHKIKEAVEENIKEILPELLSQITKHQDEEKEKLNYSMSNLQHSNYIFSPPTVTTNLHITKKGRSSEVPSPSNVCTECSQLIGGVKYACLECSNYHSCEECENKGKHPHPLLKLRVSLNNKSAICPALLSPNPRYSMHISPEKSVKSYGKTSGFGKGCYEKKISYFGKIFFDGLDNQAIQIQPFQKYSVTICVRNTGAENWPLDVKLCCVNGIYRNKEESLFPLESSAQTKINLSLEAPSQPGKYLSQWRLCYSDGEKIRSFGESLFLEIHVEEMKGRESQGKIKYNPVLDDGDYVRDDRQLKRFRTFNFVPVSREGENENKLRRAADKTNKIALYLNEIFPGDLQEKMDFLCDSRVSQEEDMCKIVELYLLHLTKVKTGRTCKIGQAYNHQSSGQLSVTLS